MCGTKQRWLWAKRICDQSCEYRTIYRCSSDMGVIPGPPTAPEDWLGGGSIAPEGTPVADSGVPAGVLLSGLISLEEPEVSPL